MLIPVPVEIEPYIAQASVEWRIDRHIIEAVMAHESGFRVDAANEVGEHSYGLMQVNIAVWTQFEKEKLLSDPEYAINAGCFILRYYFDTYKDWLRALVGYNGAGPKAEAYGQARYNEAFLRYLAANEPVIHKWALAGAPWREQVINLHGIVGALVKERDDLLARVRDVKGELAAVEHQLQSITDTVADAEEAVGAAQRRVAGV